MNVDLAEMEALKDSARDFLTRENQGERLRRRIEAGVTLDRDFWGQIAEAGWPAMLVPEDQGGLGFSLRAATAVLEEVGRSCISEPVVAVSVQAVSLLNALPESELRNDLLERIAGGELIVGTAWQQRSGQLDPELPSEAAATADGYEINASYVHVSPAQAADGWLTLLCADGEALVAWVPAAQDGLQLESEPRVDGSGAGRLRLASCRVGAAHVLGRGEPALRAVARALDLARLAQAAELLGVSRQAFDTTLEYMGVRVQFGKPIGSFQSLQHRMVDAYIQIQLLEYAIAQAIDAIELDPAALPLQASRLKVRAEQAASLMTRLAVQSHGGMGYSDESDVGLALKRALALSSELGNARAHTRRYAAELAGKAPAAVAATASDAHAWDDFPTDADWDAMPEEDFRRMLRAFFAKHYPEHLRHKAARLHWHEIKDWYQTLSRQGWIAPAWPKEYGGMALSPDKLIAYIEEQERYGVGRPPDQGLVMLGPILFRYGTPEQKARYLPPILSGEHVWAQGYSEPNAGSDLASLRCEAVPDGDHFVVNGQKTWSTLAQDATHMFMLVRTDKTVKKQAGISFLMVDLSSPGVLVRPIRTIAGDEEFCEVFFDDVRVPKENLVGGLNEGWTVSKALLGFERLFSGSPKHSQNTMGLIDRIATHDGLFDDPAFAADYARLHIDVADLSAAYAAFSEIVRRNEPLPANVSLLKIWATETHERCSLLLLDAAQQHAGSLGRVELSGPDGARLVLEDVQMPLYNAAAAKIFSGTNEIQRNILAKMVLGLPV